MAQHIEKTSGRWAGSWADLMRPRLHRPELELRLQLRGALLCRQMSLRRVMIVSAHAFVTESDEVLAQDRAHDTRVM
jgi:hypothetical protein